MFGWSEVVLTLVLAIILLGPDKLAEVARSAGRIYGEYQKAKRRLELELLYGQEIPNEERLREIHIPTLIVAGQLDPLFSAGRAMQERIEGSQFVLIKGSTHGTCVWRPDAFNRAVLDFLAKVEAGEPVAGERIL